MREHLDVEKLTRLLHGDGAAEAKGDDVGAIGAWDWGGMLVAQKMWSDLGLHATLDKATNVERTDGARLSDRVLVLVANRLMAPGSEHALARWLESDFVCDRRGRRFVAAWRKDDVRKASSTPRVRVEMRQLKQWYRTLDELLALKNDIEHALFLLLRDLFSLEVDVVFYDLTSTYFEGKGPEREGRTSRAAVSGRSAASRHGERQADLASNPWARPVINFQTWRTARAVGV